MFRSPQNTGARWFFEVNTRFKLVQIHIFKGVRVVRWMKYERGDLFLLRLIRGQLLLELANV
jgi:hypothetical protein